VHVHVRGRVQGVGFRYDARSRARSLGLGGWVRNLPDGSVEAAFEGDPDAVESMVEWCRRGPVGGRVTEVEAVDEPTTGEREFTVR
jgi:acylphosphatase